MTQPGGSDSEAPDATWRLELNGVKLETYAALYLVSGREGEPLALKLRELLSLKLLIEAVLGALHLELGGKELSMISHPDGREELILR